MACSVVLATRTGTLTFRVAFFLAHPLQAPVAMTRLNTHNDNWLQANLNLNSDRRGAGRDRAMTS